MSTLGAAVSSADNFTTLYKSATKNFSKHGILVEILLVEHRLHDVIEVVVQDSARSYEISRFYISTSILFSKFSAEEIDQHLALKKAEFSDVNKDFQYSKEPQESKIVERVIQDLAVLHVKARLDIQSGGTLKASLIVLPGDTTNADGQLDQICEMPPNMRKYQSFDLTQVEIR